MNCRDIEFSPEKSEERITRALAVFDSAVLTRILALGLHLQGASRNQIATLLERPKDSIKTSIRVLLRDGLPALRDRRYADVARVESKPVELLEISTRREGQWRIVDFGVPGKELRIPAEHKIQLRTVLLSFFNSGLLSIEDTAAALQVSEAHCRELAKKLARDDVEEALIDKRQGQTRNYRMGVAEKAQMIQQFSANAVLRLSTSSKKIEELMNEQSTHPVSARTIRWHMNKLGLKTIRKTLPDLVDAKKNFFLKLHDDRIVLKPSACLAVPMDSGLRNTQFRHDLSTDRVLKRKAMVVMRKSHMPIAAIASLTGCSASTVQRWMLRWTQTGDLHDRPRRGCPACYSDAIRIKVTAFYCQTQPLVGCGRWSLRWVYWSRYFSMVKMTRKCRMSDKG